MRKKDLERALFSLRGNLEVLEGNTGGSLWHPPNKAAIARLKAAEPNIRRGIAKREEELKALNADLADMQHRHKLLHGGSSCIIL